MMFARKLAICFVGIGVILFMSLGTVYAQRVFPQQTAKKLADPQRLGVEGVNLQISERQEMKIKLPAHQQKLSTDLLWLVDQRYLPPATRLNDHLAAMAKLGQYRIPDSENHTDHIAKHLVYAYIRLIPPASFSILDGKVVSITDRDERRLLAAAWMRIEQLDLLAQLPAVRSIRTVMPPFRNTGSMNSEGDAIHRADQARSAYGQGGGGIDLGIISDGVDNRASAQASGDLPADGAGLTVLSNALGGDEGTAMLEIVHDLAPDAGLFFHDAGANIIAFQTAIDNLVASGCTVICDDISWITEPFFEDGAVAAHLTSVLGANNLVYVKSAGNNGQNHYQGDFFPLLGNPTIHDFNEGGTHPPHLYVNIPNGSNLSAVLQWDDAFGASDNDYDLFLFSFASGAIVASSEARQNGNDDPLEVLSYQATAVTAGDFALVVSKFSGNAKTLEVFIYPQDNSAIYANNLKPADAVFGHAAVEEAIAVGAIGAEDPGNDDIRSYSSQGPSTIRIPAAQTRAKPDIAGIDGVSVTGAGGFPSTFFGTSAAAPHVAAIAVLLWGEIPDSSDTVIRDYVLNSAVDLGAPGFDTVFGAGRADALNAFTANLMAGAPEITPGGGIYNAPQTVTMTTATVNAQIYYTLNGADPTESDSLYSGPVDITESSTVKARAFRTGYNPSPVTTEEYHIFLGVVVDVKAWLEGAYDLIGDTMRTTLLENSGLPLNQPYSGAPWNYPGIESVAAIPAGVVDWVLLELRKVPTGPADAVRAAFITSDGTVVDLDGFSPVAFEFEVDNDGHHIILRQRNHLAIMSSVPVILTTSTPQYDFTFSQMQAYGLNAMKEIATGVYAARSGDGNSDGAVDILDKNLIWQVQNGTPWSYDKFGDFNLDLLIDDVDVTLFWQPNNGTASQVP